MTPNLAAQSRVALARILSNTESSSTGELAMTRKTSDVAACCSRASFSSRVRTVIFLFSAFGPGASRARRGARRRVAAAIDWLGVELIAAGGERFFARAGKSMGGERDDWDVARLRIGLEPPRRLP